MKIKSIHPNGNSCYFLSKKIERIILLLFLCVFSICCDAKVLFYRIPFRIQTYTPITREEIKILAAKNGMQELLSRNYGKVSSLLNPHKSNCYFFDDSNIRIYIRENNNEYFIDNKGIASFRYNETYECSRNKINENVITHLLNDGNVDLWGKDE
ncbi:hypothetical protein CBX57_012795 [Salmonella enterica]|nr:hypothetical protein [Salmonella enterica]